MSWWAHYIGRPFEDGARGPEAYDCWGLVRAVYAEQLGIELPSYGEISARDLGRIARTIAARSDDGWRIVGSPFDFDVALMRAAGRTRAVVHVGVMIDGTRMLHTEAATGAVVVPLTHVSVAGRITGFRRWKE